MTWQTNPYCLCHIMFGNCSLCIYTKRQYVLKQWRYILSSDRIRAYFTYPLQPISFRAETTLVKSICIEKEIWRKSCHKSLERATRIELASTAWEAVVLPLNYARIFLYAICYYKAKIYLCQVLYKKMRNFSSSHKMILFVKGF